MPIGFSPGRLTGLGLSGRLLLCLLLFTLVLLGSKEEGETIFMTYPPFSTALIFSPLQLTKRQLKTAVLGIATLRLVADHLKPFQVSSSVKMYGTGLELTLRCYGRHEDSTEGRCECRIGRVSNGRRKGEETRVLGKGTERTGREVREVCFGSDVIVGFHYLPT